MKLSSFITASIIGALSMTMSANANTIEYPTEPVRIVSPFAAGGTNDILARLSAQILTEQLKGQFVVEQRTGAGGMIGSNAVAKSSPDGNTLLMGSISTHAVAPAVFANPSFNARTDFTPISVIASVPLVLVVNKDAPYTKLEQVIEEARKNPGKLTYGTPGNGAVPHLATELMASITGVKFTHVPYRGESAAVADLLGGQIDMVFANLPSVMSHIKTGTLRPLAISTKERIKALPDLPTAAESGVKDFEVEAWYALMGPAGMDPAIVKKISDAIQNGIKDPKVVEVIRGQGAEPVGSSAEETAPYVAAEQDKWAKTVKQAGIEPM